MGAGMFTDKNKGGELYKHLRHLKKSSDFSSISDVDLLIIMVKFNNCPENL